MVAYKLNPASHDDWSRRRRAGLFLFSASCLLLPDQRHCLGTEPSPHSRQQARPQSHRGRHFRHYLL